MKKVIGVICLTAAIAALLSGCGAGSSSGVYLLDCKVTEVSTGGRVSCVDYRGEGWIFSSNKNYKKGDIVRLTMSDQGTKTFRDDIIIYVK